MLEVELQCGGYGRSWGLAFDVTCKQGAYHLGTYILRGLVRLAAAAIWDRHLA